MSDIQKLIEKLDEKLDGLNQTMNEIIIMQSKIKKMLRKDNIQEELSWYLKKNDHEEEQGYHSDGEIIKKTYYQIISDNNLIDIQDEPIKKKFSLKKMMIK